MSFTEQYIAPIAPIVLIIRVSIATNNSNNPNNPNNPNDPNDPNYCNDPNNTHNHAYRRFIVIFSYSYDSAHFRKSGAAPASSVMLLFC